MSVSLSDSMPAALRTTWVDWRSAGAVLAIGVAALALVFWPELIAAVQVWLGSTAFNHCFLVLPVAGWIAWQRRASIAATCPRPAPVLALLALPVAVAWLFAERVGVMEGRQFLAMILLQVLCLSVLGLRTWVILSAPLLYLFFLVPSGEFLTPVLQRFTVHFITAGLNLLGIVNFTDGVTIEIPEGSFFVAEACAGLRFLIASIAFGALYACTIYRSPMRRVLFIALSVIVPILANGIRALAIVAIAHWFGSQNAVATDHIFYGWLLFSIVTFLLILIGLPFRETVIDSVEMSNLDHYAGKVAKGAALALVILIVFAATPRVLASYLDGHLHEARTLTPSELAAPPGCDVVPVPPSNLATSTPVHANGTSTRAYQCGVDVFVLSLQFLPPRVGARAVFGGLSSVTAELGWELVESRKLNVGAGPLAQSWFQLEFVSHNRREIIASAVWVDGRPASGIEGRVRQALNTFVGSNISTVIARIDYVSSAPSTDSRQALDRFLQNTASLSTIIGQGSTRDARYK